MKYFLLLSALDDFTSLIAGYLKEIWYFLMFIGTAASFLVIIIGAILLFIGVKVNKATGGGLILGGVVLATIIVFFTVYPPDFVLD
ncbi:MAG: hypothetical protein ACFFCX_05280 [Candidatus Sifarchaeia archaeon]